MTLGVVACTLVVFGGRIIGGRLMLGDGESTRRGVDCVEVYSSCEHPETYIHNSHPKTRMTRRMMAARI